MIIRIKNLKCETIIGVYPAERSSKQILIINMKIKYDDGVAAESDDIKDTINYHEVVDKVRGLVESSQYNLLETLVEKIGETILEYKKVISCEIEIDKPNAPIENIDSVSVSKKFKRK